MCPIFLGRFTLYKGDSVEKNYTINLLNIQGKNLVLIKIEFKKTTLTYKSWINEITNSFIIDPVTHKRLSNGFIEGKNNFVKK